MSQDFFDYRTTISLIIGIALWLAGVSIWMTFVEIPQYASALFNQGIQFKGIKDSTPVQILDHLKNDPNVSDNTYNEAKALLDNMNNWLTGYAFAALAIEFAIVFIIKYAFTDKSTREIRNAREY